MIDLWRVIENQVISGDDARATTTLLSAAILLVYGVIGECSTVRGNIICVRTHVCMYVCIHIYTETQMYTNPLSSFCSLSLSLCTESRKKQCNTKFVSIEMPKAGSQLTLTHT